MDRIKVQEIAHHRNGISGEPFHVVTFTWNKQQMVGVVFTDPKHVAVFDRTMLGQADIAFAVNSWRGDEFEPQLRAAIAKEEA